MSEVRTQWWADYPWRHIQTNLRQIDMEDIDAEEYVRQLKAFGASIAMINVGGIIASYPTELEDQTQSEFLHGDSLAKIIDRCHEEQIKVIARMDFSKVREPVFQRHPDWAYRTKDGRIVNYNGDVHACICGGYQQSYVYEIVREVIGLLPIDGMFFNMGGFNERDYSYNQYGICHCDNCKRKFREMFGLDLPTVEDMDDPVYRKYLVFKERITRHENQRMSAFIRNLNPNIAIDAFDFKRCESNTEYKRPLPFFQFSASSNTRMLRGISQTIRPSNCSVDFVGFFYRHVAVSPAQQKLRLYQALANLGGLDYYLIGRLDNHLDRSGYEAIKEVFSFHKAHEADYPTSLRSVADILLLKTKLWEAMAEERGWVRALTESHVLFDEAMEQEVLANDLDKYRTIIVPGIARLSSALVKKLEEFARKGGCVVVVGNSGKLDENADEVPFPFAGLTGVEQIEYPRTDMVSSMFRRSEAELAQFPSMKDFEVLMVGDEYLYASYDEKTERYLSLIPPHSYGPPERCYFTQITDYPGVTVRRFGEGRGIFVPWMPGTLYHREGYENTFAFMKDVILKIVGASCVAEDLSPMVEVTLARSGDESYRLLQLVNCSGHFGTSYVEPLEVRDITVCVPCEGTVTEASSLVSGSPVPFEQDGNRVTVRIPKLGDFESIKLVQERGDE